MQQMVSTFSVIGCPVHRLRENSLFYNKFLMILYMFRALYGHYQEVELY